MPSRPVRLVSDGGMPVRVVTGGLSDPVRVVTNGPSDPVRVVTSGPSDPVRVISGSLTPVISDPIGDGLRADVVAYWTMNETSGTRIDATGRGNDAADNGSVGYAAGKAGNAAAFSNTSGQALIVPNNSDTHLAITTFAVSFWFKMGVNDNGQYIMLFKYDNVAAGPEIMIYYTELPQEFRAGTVDLIAISMPQDTSWHFIVFYQRIGAFPLDASPNEIGVSIDHAAFVAVQIVDNVDINEPLYIDSDMYDTYSELTLDEVALIKRASPTSNTVLTQDEIDYLWNSGAGRTLFP